MVHDIACAQNTYSRATMCKTYFQARTCIVNTTLPVYMKTGTTVKKRTYGQKHEWQPNLARVRETGPTSAKHSHLAKITVSRQCSWSPGQTLKKMSCNPTLPVYTQLGRLVRNTVIWPKSLC